MNLENFEWIKTLGKFKYIMIFGATNNAKHTYLYVKDAGFDILCYIVSERNNNPFYIDEKPVKVFSEVDEEIKKSGLVIVSQVYASDNAMRNILLYAGFKNVLSSPMQVAPEMTKDLKRYCESILGEMRMVESFMPDKTHFETCDKEVCIYVVTSHRNLHKANTQYMSRFIKYIQAGAKLSSCKMCDITDDTGDNISELNAYFCELSAGYWIYKNDHTNDYVGLYHYSRGLDVTDEQIKNIVENEIDVVLPIPLVTRHEVIMRGLCSKGQLIFDAISRVSPEYLDAAERYFGNKLFFAGNLIFAKKIVYCQYYEWMFKVINECINIMQKSSVTERIWGYFGEHLTNIYFFHHISQYTILYANIKNLI